MNKDSEELLKVKGTSGVILVIEDEDVLVQITQTSLEMSGYSVLTAKDGMDGVRSFQVHQNKIDLVVCDLNMPNLDGHSALQEISALRPDMKVVVVSGSVETPDFSQFPGSSEFIFLQKPYRMEKLITAVGRLLEKDSNKEIARKVVGM
jgi:two-component system, cell cycle sensor histidine kinase and response regulator CckA